MNLKSIMVAVATVTLIGLSTVEYASAQVTPMLTEGTRSLNVSGSLDDDGDDMNLVAAASAGYFFMNDIQVGVNLGTIFIGSDYKVFSGGVFGEYNFDIGGPLVPYVGASVALGWWDTPVTDDSVFIVSGYGGARYFFVDHAAIGAKLEIDAATEDIYNNGDDSVDWALMVETSWFF